MHWLIDFLVIIAIIAVAYAIDWLFVMGAIYFICKCFMWKFSLLTATGVWIILELARCVFRGSRE